MEIFWNIFFWIALVAVVAIISGVVVRVVTRMAQAREYIADAYNGVHYKALAERTETLNADVLERLGSVDGRLATIEKTLTNIP